ncbi:MAG: radical SAM protein [Chloroflexota bacterium]
MTNLLAPLRRMFNPLHEIEAGIYHYISPPNDPRNYRLHLRLESDGSGVLIINAATILHLNQTAAEYAYYLVHNTPADQVARKFSARYNVSRAQASQDYLQLAERIQTLISTPDIDPVTFLDFERQVPYSGQISAPYRLDCALTYRLPTDTSPDAAPVERVKRELDAEEWKTLIDKAWSASIPHIVFTGGEPTLRSDLTELIAHAEANGQISGLLSDGLRLAESAYLEELLQTGLDHLMLVLRPEEPLAWQALENALAQDLFVAVHLTLAAENVKQIPKLLRRLADMGVHAVSLSASDPSLATALHDAREQIARLEMELVWNLPVPYSSLHPIALETSQPEIPEGAGRAWLYVEPDGDVLPSQGVNRVLGNLLADPWEKIWKSTD